MTFFTHKFHIFLRYLPDSSKTGDIYERKSTNFRQTNQHHWQICLWHQLILRFWPVGFDRQTPGIQRIAF